MSKPLQRALCEVIPAAAVVTTQQQFVDAPRDARTISFIDGPALASLDRLAVELGARAQRAPTPEWRKLLAAVSLGPVIAVCEETISTALGWLPAHPWLSHVLSSDLLGHPMAKQHLEHVLEPLTAGGQPRLLDWLKPTGVGRRIRLTHASKRNERLGKMADYFAGQGVSTDSITRLRESAEELLTNAFYNAPVAAAGAEVKRISRSHDVALPEDSACDMAYGVRDGLAVVRVRDPFGSLSRDRLVEVLTRGPTGGTGLTRVFERSPIVAVSVVRNGQTEVLVGVPEVKRGKPYPWAFHWFFKDGPRRGVWKLIDENTGNQSITGSITLTMLPE